MGRVAAGTADAATGNLTDFDKRGGKVRGPARVVGGAIDKLTGDRTDLDKRGATPLNKGQRDALNNKKPTQSTPQAKPVSQAKPQQSVKSPMDQLNPGASKVQARFKEREAKGLSGLTGKPKGQPQLSLSLIHI